MGKRTVIALALSFALLIGVCAASAGDVNNAAAQAAMKAYIDKKTAGGAYAIKGVKASFVKMHKEVLNKDGFLVSCAEFKAGGDLYDVDIYARGSGSQYTVVMEVLHKKNGQEANVRLWP